MTAVLAERMAGEGFDGKEIAATPRGDSGSRRLSGWISSLRGNRGELEERPTLPVVLAALVGAVGGWGRQSKG